MIPIKTKNFPPKGYDAVLIFPFLFTKVEVTEKIRKHERVHQRQYLIFVAIGLVIFGIKYWLIGPAWNIPFLILPFVLFYLVWYVLYLIKGYDGIALEINAVEEESE